MLISCELYRTNTGFCVHLKNKLVGRKMQNIVFYRKVCTFPCADTEGGGGGGGPDPPPGKSQKI